MRLLQTLLLLTYDKYLFYYKDPRKIAHRILTVRENLCQEIMDDLGSIRNENNEAARIAGIYVKEGAEAARKSRRPTRMSDQQGSTPLRDKNFLNCDVMVNSILFQYLIYKYLMEVWHYWL